MFEFKLCATDLTSQSRVKMHTVCVLPPDSIYDKQFDRTVGSTEASHCGRVHMRNGRDTWRAGAGGGGKRDEHQPLTMDLSRSQK